ncbi:hypothetical protein G647_05556 [Cladophialophora carrionii CBS 160.54]|uniref:Uncharacterized protein n=1 Tax=Cladophialophora carrionii CBS 160.54 TaxID=1279043 RepID=V9DA78_9EURO|nr:uncharacterized protein G647_05556 [Cladophialophora carrionii CBS 160.54]ETI23750.1 hypothetical protein G647_05556 [Cladophialophora carrionii CBS 160.54]
MTSFFTNLPTYLLASVVLLGAFSRFTHGEHTPQFYAFQEYHAPDDGSTGAKITPIIDLLVGLSLLFGSKAVRLSAASISLGLCAVGLVVQMKAGKEYNADIALVALAAISVLSQLRRR